MLSSLYLQMNLPESLLRLEAMVVIRPEFWKRCRRAGGKGGGAWDGGDRGGRRGVLSFWLSAALPPAVPPLDCCCSSGGKMSPDRENKFVFRSWSTRPVTSLWCLYISNMKKSNFQYEKKLKWTSTYLFLLGPKRYSQPWYSLLKHNPKICTWIDVLR